MLAYEWPRKFTYGNKRLESTKEALIKNQAFEILVLYYAFDFLMATLRLVLLYVFDQRKICMSRACLLEVLCTLDIHISSAFWLIKRTKLNNASPMPYNPAM